MLEIRIRHSDFIDYNSECESDVQIEAISLQLRIDEGVLDLCKYLRIQSDLWQRHQSPAARPTETSQTECLDSFKQQCEAALEGHEGREDILEFLMVTFEEGHTSFASTWALLQQHSFDFEAVLDSLQQPSAI